MVNLCGKKIVVTGGTGFIGKNLVRKLEILGAQVFILDRNSKLSIDIRDFERIKNFLTTFKPHFIFHLAGVLGKNDEDENLIMDINYGGTKNLLRAYDNYEKFVYVSTSELYFGNVPPFREDMGLNPTSNYSESKLKSEIFCKDLIRQGKPIVVVRPSIVFGPNQNTNMFIPSLISKCLKDEEFRMTLGEQTRDFIFIDDLINLFIKILDSKSADGNIFNAATGMATSLREVANLVIKLTNSKSNIQFGLLPYRKNEIMEYYHDISKAKSLLGWIPEYNLEEGLKITIDSYK